MDADASAFSVASTIALKLRDLPIQYPYIV